MSKKTELFTSNHAAQSKWIDGQIAKNNMAIFLNPHKAETAWDELKSELFIDDQALEYFVGRYLSETGIKKLYTTLRVAETRAKKTAFRLQCNIEYAANQKLEKMMRQTGQSKGELLSRLIEQATVTESKTLHCNKIVIGEQREEL